MTIESECPDLETLASLADGELGPEEARVVRVHLANCENCYTVFAELASYLESRDPAQSDSASAPSHPQGRPARAWIRWALPIAAVLLLLVLAPRLGWFDRSEAIPTGVVAELLTEGASPDQFAGLIEARPDELTFSGQLSRESLSFRLGVLFLDLRLSEPSSPSWEALRTETARLMEASPELASEAESVRTNRKGAISGASRASRKSLAPKFFDLGSWTEGCRLAAATGNRSFFADPRTQEFFLEQLRKEPLPSWAEREVAGLSQMAGAGKNVNTDAMLAAAERVRALF